MSKKSQQRVDHRGIRLPQDSCPTCHDPFNAATEVNGLPARPSPGDFSVCCKCGEVCMFNDDMTVRAVPLEELERTAPEVFEDIDKAVKYIKQRNKRELN